MVKSNPSMTDKTQEELEEIFKKFTNEIVLNTSDAYAITEILIIARDKAIKSINHYINKYYVPRDDGLEVTPSRRKATNNQADKLSVFKKDKNVLKFMKKYRYQYYATMLPDLATLVKNAYQEGYWNGVDQHRVTDLLVKDSTPPQSVSNVPTEDKRVVEARIDELGKVERWYSENTGTTSYSALTQDIKDRIKELEGNK